MALRIFYSIFHIVHCTRQIYAMLSSHAKLASAFYVLPVFAFRLNSAANCARCTFHFLIHFESKQYRNILTVSCRIIFTNPFSTNEFIRLRHLRLNIRVDFCFYLVIYLCVDGFMGLKLIRINRCTIDDRSQFFTLRVYLCAYIKC